MGLICNLGICFVLGWHEDSKDEVVRKLSNLCQSIGSNESERCWQCSTSKCFVKDKTYKMRIARKDIGVFNDFNLNNILLSCNQKDGWFIA